MYQIGLSPDQKTADNKETKKVKKTPLALQYVKRVLRDAFLLMGVVVAVSWGQSFKFSGKYVDPAVFAEKYPALTDSGATLSLAPVQDMVLIYIFAPWCKVCHMNADVVSSQWISSRYEIKGLAMSYEGVSDVERFVRETGFRAEVLLANQGLEAELTNNLGVKEFPTYLVISRKGEVLTGWSGYTTTLGLWVRMVGIRFFSSHLL